VSAVRDLIGQIEDFRLRERLEAEWVATTRDRKFGLVFEQHLPELLPVLDAKPAPGDLVARKEGGLTQIWRVRGVLDGYATCVAAENGIAEPTRLPIDQLVVLKQFGEPIFPSLQPLDRVQNCDARGPWHTVIEADNYHALQLLEYLHAGAVDCIYIDPPYNTGARDWKYNNNYVDSSDAWRHSKWLAFMERRLKISRKLLNPSHGVLIVTIDEHEVHHLGMLLRQIFPECTIQMATAVINQQGVAQGGLARTEEYIFFVFMPDATLRPAQDDLLSPQKAHDVAVEPRWERLLRGGTGARRADRPTLFYPIFVEPETGAIISIGDPLPPEEIPDFGAEPERTVAWPIRKDGSFGRWQLSPASLRQLMNDGMVKLGGYDRKRRTWTVHYLNRGTRARIQRGEIIVTGRDPITGAAQVKFAEQQSGHKTIKTVWHRGLHDAGVYGSSLLRTILGPNKFSFPKSIYATRDAIGAVVRDRPDALVMDFFAGSGTTLNAVNLLNAVDGGTRRCIIVTNNEVSSEEAEQLTARGYKPGDDEWEALGICRAVTWPRTKFTLLGRRDDDTPLSGEYLTGRTAERERPRKFHHVGFVAGDALTGQAKKQLAALLDIPQSALEAGDPFVIAPGANASILFDEGAVDAWMVGLEELDSIETLAIVAADKRKFEQIKKLVDETLPPRTIVEDEKRPMSDGFQAGVEYFKLQFLDSDSIALKKRFSELLPLLWMKTGAKGARPEVDLATVGGVFAPEGSNFAVLLNESAFGESVEIFTSREDLEHAFIVTDDDEAFQEMAQELAELISGRAVQSTQLYRDYLSNFMINRGVGG